MYDDNKAQQEEEVEAVKSIYNEECEIVQTKPFFQLRVRVSGQSNNFCAHCFLKFDFNAGYPLESPLQCRIEDPDNLEDNDIAELTAIIENTIRDNAGCVLVFAIVANVQEHLVAFSEGVAKRVEVERELKRVEAEEAEKRRFEGTQVSMETFNVWRTRFNEEQAEIERREAKATAGTGSKRLTGRELFTRDATLVTSDEAMRDSDDVVVDESLFNELDLLELDDSGDGTTDKEDDSASLHFSDSDDDE